MRLRLGNTNLYTSTQNIRGALLLKGSKTLSRMHHSREIARSDFAAGRVASRVMTPNATEPSLSLEVLVWSDSYKTLDQQIAMVLAPATSIDTGGAYLIDLDSQRRAAVIMDGNETVTLTGGLGGNRVGAVVTLPLRMLAPRWESTSWTNVPLPSNNINGTGKTVTFTSGIWPHSLMITALSLANLTASVRFRSSVSSSPLTIQFAYVPSEWRLASSADQGRVVSATVSSARAVSYLGQTSPADSSRYPATGYDPKYNLNSSNAFGARAISVSDPVGELALPLSGQVTVTAAGMMSPVGSSCIHYREAWDNLGGTGVAGL